MSERWIQVSERILEKLKNLEKTKDKDRLEHVRSLSIILNILQRSLIGWMQWVNNPDIMSIFSQEDLENMTKKLSDFTCLFVKYDLEVTRLGAKKGLKTPKGVKNIKSETRPERFYI